MMKSLSLLTAAAASVLTTNQIRVAVHVVVLANAGASASASAFHMAEEQQQSPLLWDTESSFLKLMEQHEQQQQQKNTISSRRQLMSFCKGPKQTHYFDVELRIFANSNSTDVCNLADQTFLGNALNTLLLDYGIGDAGIGDESIYLASVCPTPETLTTRRQRRRGLLQLQQEQQQQQQQPPPEHHDRYLQWTFGKVFVYQGSGGCRFCLGDNIDKRKRHLLRRTANAAAATATVYANKIEEQPQRQLQSSSDTLPVAGAFSVAPPGSTLGRPLDNWFNETFKPETEATLEAAILQEIVPNHQSCLGSDPVVEVTITETSFKDLNALCKDGTYLDTLKSLSFSDFVLSTRECNSCAALDFSKMSNGDPFAKGDYVKVDEWSKLYGINITATSSSPSSSPTTVVEARIFDTNDTSCLGQNGNLDFGSPNKDCAGGGPGYGEGGGPNTEGENCRPLGNILIIQDADKLCPDASASGGILTFTWETPVLISDIGLMDIDESNQRMTFTYADGYAETFMYEGFGDNAVQRVVANKINVIKLEIQFPGTGAVTELNFCPECIVEDAHGEDHTCISIEDGSILIKPEEVLSFQDFETRDTLKGWNQDILNSSETASFTTFLGPYARGQTSPYKVFAVPRDVDAIIISLDFYEIDDWSLGDYAQIFVDGDKIDLGGFLSSADEGQRSGTTSFGIRWTLDSIGPPEHLGFNSNFKDQKHHIVMTIPLASGLYNNGELRLTLGTKLANVGPSAGWDNIQVMARGQCERQVLARSAPSNPDQAPNTTATVMAVADLNPNIVYLGFGNAQKISTGHDGTLASVTSMNSLWQSELGYGWSSIEAEMERNLTSEDNDLYQVAVTDDNYAYRWNGSAWKLLAPSVSINSTTTTGAAASTARALETISGNNSFLFDASHLSVDRTEPVLVGRTTMSSILDVAVCDTNSLYGLFSDDKVYYHSKSLANPDSHVWQYEGPDNVATIATTSSGTIATIDKTFGSITVKTKNGNESTSITVPTVLNAKDVTLLGNGNLYYVASDSSVYRTTNYTDPGVKVGDHAAKIDAGEDGTIVVVKNDGGLIQKRQDDELSDWHLIRGIDNAAEIAVVNKTTCFITNTKMKVYRIMTA